MSDLSRDELSAPARALVVEKDARGDEQTVTFAVIDRDPVPIELRDTVRRAWVERRPFVLRGLRHLAEHLGRGRLIDTGRRAGEPHCLEQPRDAERGHLTRKHRLLPGGRDEALRRQVVDLVGLNLIDDGEERCLVEEVCAKELDAIAEMLDAATSVRTRAACDTNDTVAKVEKVLGQIAAVLTGDAGDERRSGIHAPVSPLSDM